METWIGELLNDLYDLEATMSMPIGSIFVLPNDGLPAHLLRCDGAQYARVDYPDLYAALDWSGSPYIVDVDNFTVPNLADHFVMGSDGTNEGDTGGDNGEQDHGIDKLLTSKKRGPPIQLLGELGVCDETTGKTDSAYDYCCVDGHERMGWRHSVLV